MKTEKEFDYLKELKQTVKPLLLQGIQACPCGSVEDEDYNIIEWYEVKSPEDLQNLKNLYMTVPALNVFPEIICVQKYNEQDRIPDIETLSHCKEYVEQFFDFFGIEVEFRPKKTAFDTLIDKIRGYLYKYDANNVDIILNEETRMLDVIYHSKNNSFPIESGIACYDTVDLKRLEEEIDKLNIGHCW